MKFRTAKPADFKVLAEIHLECGQAQVGSFMHKLGLGFLKSYYKILLNEKHSIVIIAEDENNNSFGFHSGTTNAEEHFESLRKNKVKLGISIVPSLIKDPRLVKSVILRNSFVNHSKEESFSIRSGPRAEYWAWRPSNVNPAASAILRRVWSKTIFSLGIKSFKLEIDLANTDVEKYCKAFSCTVLNEVCLPDGRKRAILEQKRK